MTYRYQKLNALLLLLRCISYRRQSEGKYLVIRMLLFHINTNSLTELEHFTKVNYQPQFQDFIWTVSPTSGSPRTAKFLLFVVRN
jgi:hypothetical protein